MWRTGAIVHCHVVDNLSGAVEKTTDMPFSNQNPELRIAGFFQRKKAMIDGKESKTCKDTALRAKLSLSAPFSDNSPRHSF